MYKLSYFLMYFGIFVVINAALAGISIYNKNVDMNGRQGMDKISVKVIEKHGEVYFTRNDIEDLKKNLETQDMAYSSTAESSITYKSGIYKTKIVGVNYRYNEFNDIRIKFGSFFTSIDEKNETNTVIIGSDLALDIFNTDKVIGREIEIFGKGFKIIGVYEYHGARDRNGAAGKNIIEWLTDDGIPCIYIPVDVLMQYGNTLGIDSLQVNIGSGGTLDDNEDKVKAAVQGLGKNISSYKVTDINKIGVLLKELPQLLVFIMGCIVILYILGYARSKFSALLLKIKKDLKELYFLNAVKKYIRDLIALALTILGILILLIVVWRTIKFDLYIPSEYIPEDITDLRYYSDIIKDKVIQYNSEAGFIPDITEIRAHISLCIEQLLFLLSLSGLAAIYLGFTLMKHLKKPPVKLAMYCSACILFSILISLILTKYLGLAFFFDIKFIMIFNIFLMCPVLKMTSEPFNEKNERVFYYD